MHRLALLFLASPAVKRARTALLLVATLALGGCEDPQIYGSVGISSGFGGYGGWGSPRMRTSISVGGRIR
jgi:hypothetical protein